MTEYDTKDWIKCTTNLGKLRSELTEAQATIENLKKQNEILSGALKYMRGDHGIACPAMVKSSPVVINEALAQIEKMKG